MNNDANNNPFWVGTEYVAPGVRAALELAYAHRGTDRVRIWHGDTDTGQSWQEENDVLGYVGRSTGIRKVPLLIYSRRSRGGGAIFPECVVRIDWVKDRRPLYKHPTFSSGFEHARIGSTPPGRDWGTARPFSVVNNDGEYVAAFESEAQARRWLEFMRGDRYSK